LATERCSFCLCAASSVGARGPAKTFTPIHVWDLRLSSDQRVDLSVPDGYMTALVVLHGGLRINGSDPIAEAEVGLFDQGGKNICIDSAKDTTALLLAGEPIDEPIVGR
jgi:redox-sensitive bicupin YhaK (pirin superfamily)